eukprot:scaffold3183_cov381-Prasinococcus_capsulatus_cf.AAC.7
MSTGQARVQRRQTVQYLSFAPKAGFGKRKLKRSTKSFESMLAAYPSASASCETGDMPTTAQLLYSAACASPRVAGSTPERLSGRSLSATSCGRQLRTCPPPVVAAGTRRWPRAAARTSGASERRPPATARWRGRGAPLLLRAASGAVAAEAPLGRRDSVSVLLAAAAVASCSAGRSPSRASARMAEEARSAAERGAACRGPEVRRAAGRPAPCRGLDATA